MTVPQNFLRLNNIKKGELSVYDLIGAPSASLPSSTAQTGEEEQLANADDSDSGLEDEWRCVRSTDELFCGLPDGS